MPKKKGYFGLFQSARQDKTKRKGSKGSSLQDHYGSGKSRHAAIKKLEEIKKKEREEEGRIKREEIRKKKEEERRKKNRKNLPKSGMEKRFRRKSEYS